MEREKERDRERKKNDQWRSGELNAILCISNLHVKNSGSENLLVYARELGVKQKIEGIERNFVRERRVNNILIHFGRHAKDNARSNSNAIFLGFFVCPPVEFSRTNVSNIRPELPFS